MNDRTFQVAGVAFGICGLCDWRVGMVAAYAAMLLALALPQHSRRRGGWRPPKAPPTP